MWREEGDDGVDKFGFSPKVMESGGEGRRADLEEIEPISVHGEQNSKSIDRIGGSEGRT